jgi:hypothetical protein
MQTDYMTLTQRDTSKPKEHSINSVLFQSGIILISYDFCQMPSMSPVCAVERVYGHAVPETRFGSIPYHTESCTKVPADSVAYLRSKFRLVWTQIQCFRNLVGLCTVRPGVGWQETAKAELIRPKMKLITSFKIKRTNKLKGDFRND